MLTFTRTGAEGPAGVAPEGAAPADASPGAAAPRLVAGRVDSTGRSVEMRLLSGSIDDPAWLERATAAANRAAMVRSPYIAQVVGFGTVDGAPALAFEPVSGPSLAELVDRDGPMSWLAARDYLDQIATGLAAIHAAGLLHGNLSLATVRVPLAGLAKLTDVGFDSSVAPARPAAGALAGRAPEGLLDARSDLYGLGAIALQLLTGSPNAPSSIDQARRLRYLPLDAQELIVALTAEDPEGRPESASAVVDALRQPAMWLSPAAPNVWPEPVARSAPAPRPGGGYGGADRGGAAFWKGVIFFVIAVFAIVIVNSSPHTVSQPSWNEPSWNAWEPYSDAPWDPGAQALVVSRLKAWTDGMEFSGRLVGELSAGGAAPIPFSGQMSVDGDDSDIVLGPDLFDDTMPRYSEVVRTPKAVYFCDRQSGEWVQTPRYDPTFDSFARLFRDVTDVVYAGDSDVGGVPAHRYAMVLKASYVVLFGFERNDYHDPSDIAAEVWAGDDGALLGMQLQFDFVDVRAGADVKNWMTVWVVFDQLTNVTITPPEGPFATPTPERASASTSASTSPASAAFVARVLAAIQAPSFRFAATYKGGINSENISRTFTGTILASGDDSDVTFDEGGPGDAFLNPRFDRLVRVGPTLYQLSHLTTVWDVDGRPAAGGDSFRSAFRGIRTLTDRGTIKAGGVTVHRLVADSVSPNFANVFGVDPGEVSNVRVGLELWVADDGSLVGLETMMEWTKPPEQGQSHYSMTIDALFDRLTGVSIEAPV